MTTMIQKTTDELRCHLCGTTKADHIASNHEFSLSGQLIPRKEAPRMTVRPGTGNADLALRALLVGKGIITPEELAVIQPPTSKGSEHGKREESSPSAGG